MRMRQRLLMKTQLSDGDSRSLIVREFWFILCLSDSEAYSEHC